MRMELKRRGWRERTGLFFGAAGLAWLFFLRAGPGLSATMSSGPKEADQRWFKVNLESETIGYIKETGSRVQQSGRWRWRSVSESKITINRLGQKIEMTLRAEYLEREDGRLEKIITDQVLSSSRVRTEIQVLENKFEIKTMTDKQTFRRELPYDGQLLGPMGIGLLSAESLNSPGDKIEYRTILPELGRVVSGERELVGEEEVECGRNKIRARKIIEKISPLVTSREVWLDADGNEIKAVEPSPFGQLITCLSSEQEVMEAMAASTGREQFFFSSLIKADVRLPQARRLERLVVRLTHKKPELGWPELENEYQKILEKNNGSLAVELSRVIIKGGGPGKLQAAELKPYLEASSYLDFNDPEIKKAAAQAIGREKDAAPRALKLRDWVSENLTFDPGFVFAPASEVLRDKKATCAGYAALLAALLRASGIPSSYLVGLAYVNGVWGGHAWVEAWLDGQWVPLDAALPSPGPADAARLAIARSSLKDGLTESLLAAQRFFGYVTVEVLEFNLGQRTIQVPAGQPLYEIKNGKYWNNGLQIGLRAPDGFNFSEVDRTWPDKTLLALSGPDGPTVRILQESWFPADKPEQHLWKRLGQEVREGRPAYLTVWGKRHPALVSGEVAAAAVKNGVDLFIVIARGANSEKLLIQVLNNLENKLMAIR
ncbi:MAG: transglutaminase-like domain-containing protein [Candidatus Saccharicenans sp.]|nr:transglutaminase-like domain-containing protein [Candidatus Saccharicenans sp.]